MLLGFAKQIQCELEFNLNRYLVQQLADFIAAKQLPPWERDGTLYRLLHADLLDRFGVEVWENKDRDPERQSAYECVVEPIVTKLLQQVPIEDTEIDNADFRNENHGA